MKKRKHAMPGYYGKNIARDAQKKFLRRKATEANQEKRRGKPEPVAQSAGEE